MTTSPTALLLGKLLDQSNLMQREVAAKAGFPKPNVITMMKQGSMRVPIERIPALARACGADPQPLLACAMQEYAPSSWRVLRDSHGEPLSDTEAALLRVYRAVIDGCLPPITPGFEKELVKLFQSLRKACETATRANEPCRRPAEQASEEGR